MAFKAFMFHYAIPHLGFDSSYNFWGGRNICISVLDNFMLGMTLAFVEKNCRQIIRSNVIRIVLAAVSAWGVYAVAGYLVGKGCHTDNLYGYTYHSVLTLVCTIFLYFASSIVLSDKLIQYNGIIRFLLWLSKYSYAVYLLHLEIARNVMAKSAVFIVLRDRHKILAYLGLYVITIAFGYLIHKLTENIHIRNAFMVRKEKEERPQ